MLSKENSSLPNQCKCVLETYSEEPTLWFILTEGAVRVKTSNYPLKNSDGRATFHRDCDCCKTEAMCTLFILVNYSDIPAHVLLKIPETNTFSSKKQYICNECLSEFNSVSESLIKKNSAEFIADLI